MYEYMVMSEQKVRLQHTLDEQAGRGWRLHTAILTSMNTWELIFERSATPPMPMVNVGYSEVREFDFPAGMVSEGVVTLEPPVKVKGKPGRKPKAAQ